MSHVDSIAQELQDRAIIKRRADEDTWRYGTTDAATLRAIHQHEAELYRDEGLLERCVGCGKQTSIMLMTGCAECGEQVCAKCCATCPHTAEGATR